MTHRVYGMYPQFHLILLIFLPLIHTYLHTQIRINVMVEVRALSAGVPQAVCVCEAVRSEQKSERSSAPALSVPYLF